MVSGGAASLLSEKLGSILQSYVTIEALTSPSFAHAARDAAALVAAEPDPAVAQQAAALLSARVRERSPAAACAAVRLLVACVPAAGPDFRRLVAARALPRILYLAVPDKGTHPVLQRSAAAAVRSWADLPRPPPGAEGGAFLAGAADDAGDPPDFARAARELARRESDAAGRPAAAALQRPPAHGVRWRCAIVLCGNGVRAGGRVCRTGRAKRSGLDDGMGGGGGALRKPMHPIRAEGRMPSAGRVGALTEVGVTGGEIAQSAPTTEGLRRRAGVRDILGIQT
jgi:hypothetical protein